MTHAGGDIQRWSESLEGKQPQDILAAAVERYRPPLILA